MAREHESVRNRRATGIPDPDRANGNTTWRRAQLPADIGHAEFELHPLEIGFSCTTPVFYATLSISCFNDPLTTASHQPVIASGLVFGALVMGLTPARFFIRLIAVLVLNCISASAILAQGFGQFAEKPINAPGSYDRARDPTGTAPERRVHLFSIDAGTCSARPYGNGFNDCHFQSVRSQLFETNQVQPREAWYGWYMYLPPSFPLSNQQQGGEPFLRLLARSGMSKS